MAMTQLSVLWILSIAVLLSLGLLRDFDDVGTSLLSGFTAETFWAVGGISAFSVHAEAWSGSRPMDQLAILSVGMSMLVVMLTVYEIVTAVRSTTGATTQSALD